MEKEELICFERDILRLKLEKFIYLGLLMDYSPLLRGNVAIYGAGLLGKLVYSTFDNKPKAFIDKRSGLGNIEKTPVYCIEDCPKEIMLEIDSLIITPVWALDEISDNIARINSRINIVSLERLVDKL